MKTEVGKYKLGAIAVVTILIAGCGGELSFKRGANSTELMSTQKVCKSTSQNSQDYEACMGNAGWVVKNFDEKDPVLDVEVTDNLAVSNPSTPAAAFTPASATAPAASKPDTAAVPAMPATPMPVAKSDDVFKVNSWWKMGGSDRALKTAMDSCVAELGEAHQPDMVKQQVTRGLLVCMKKAGWSGLRTK